MAFHTLYPFIVTSNVVELPLDKLVPIINNVIAATNGHSLSFIFSVTEKPESTKFTTSGLFTTV